MGNKYLPLPPILERLIFAGTCLKFSLKRVWTWWLLGVLFFGAPAVLNAEPLRNFKSFQDFFYQQLNPVSIEAVALFENDFLRPGETFDLWIRLDIQEGWHVYSLEVLGHPQLSTQIRIHSNAFIPVSNWQESTPQMRYDKLLQKTVKSHVKKAEFNSSQIVPESTPSGNYTIAGSLTYSACNNTICTLPKVSPFHTRVVVEADPKP